MNDGVRTGPKISVIIPALNEERGIETTLRDLEPARDSGHEIIVVDGGSTDETAALASSLADLVIQASRGRATQMNEGARMASGDVFWFIHADTRVPPEAVAAVTDAIDTGHCWGRFDVRLSGSRPGLRVVERSMNLRSRLSGICTGDQGLFVTRAAFESVGHFPDIPLMEDIALSKALRELGRPACPKLRLVTSSRRWERKGVWRTVLLMWRLRLAYALGVDPERLARRYYP